MLLMLELKSLSILGAVFSFTVDSLFEVANFLDDLVWRRLTELMGRSSVDNIGDMYSGTDIFFFFSFFAVTIIESSDMMSNVDI